MFIAVPRNPKNLVTH